MPVLLVLEVREQTLLGSRCRIKAGEQQLAALAAQKLCPAVRVPHLADVCHQSADD